MRDRDLAELAVPGRVEVVDAAFALALGASALDLRTLGRGERLVVGGDSLDVVVAGHRPETRTVRLVVPVQRVVLSEDPEHLAVRPLLEEAQVHQVDLALGHVHIHPSDIPRHLAGATRRACGQAVMRLMNH